MSRTRPGPLPLEVLVSSAAGAAAPLPAAVFAAAPLPPLAVGVSVRRTLALHSCAASSTSCRPKLRRQTGLC